MAAVDITIRSLMNYMDESARQAVANLTERTSKDIDDLTPAEIVAEANDIRRSEGRVAPTSCCPGCSEDRMDHLVWDANGLHVTCATCNTMYWPQ